MELQNLTILITGGGSGIGLAFAKVLLQRGNRVIICGRHREKLLAAQARYPQLEILGCDITQRADVDALAEFIEERYGNLHMLINNAGIQCKVNLLENTDERDAIEQEIGVNLTAPIQLTQRLLPLLLREPAAIVNLTSALAVVPKQSTPIYCAAKAGLHNFTRTLGYQLRGSGIKVFEVMPALVDTPMTADRPAKKGKISPEQLVKEALRGIEKDRTTIYVERTRLLMAIYRLFPLLAYRILRDE